MAMTATELMAWRDQMGWSLTEAAEPSRAVTLACAELTRRYGMAAWPGALVRPAITVIIEPSPPPDNRRSGACRCGWHDG